MRLDGPLARGAWLGAALVLVLHAPASAAPPSGGPVAGAADPPEAFVAPAGDTLPFAGGPVPVRYPSLGASLGAGWFVSDFGDVEGFFRASERAYTLAGYPAGPSKGVFVGPMPLSTVTLSLAPRLDLAFQAGVTGGKDDEVKVLGALASYRRAFARARGLSWTAGAGGGVLKFSFTRHYGVTVSPDSAGYHYVLDSVELSGGSGYWTVAGGVVQRVGELALEARAQYVGATKVSADVRRGGNVPPGTGETGRRVTLDMSGVLLGASFTIFF